MTYATPIAVMRGVCDTMEYYRHTKLVKDICLKYKMESTAHSESIDVLMSYIDELFHPNYKDRIDDDLQQLESVYININGESSRQHFHNMTQVIKRLYLKHGFVVSLYYDGHSDKLFMNYVELSTALAFIASNDCNPLENCKVSVNSNGVILIGVDPIKLLSCIPDGSL